MAGRVAFTEAQVRRAVKGALDGGLQIGCVEVTADGRIRLLPREPDRIVDRSQQEPQDGPRPKQWPRP